MSKSIVLKRKIFLNKKTGQASLVLPKKQLIEFFNKIPKEVRLEIRGIKW